jgi:putative nucleotidyltransferase with HDIG domain
MSQPEQALALGRVSIARLGRQEADRTSGTIMQELEAYLSRAKHLPPAPRVLPELLGLLRSDEVDTERVVTVIAYDPSLTAAVLQLCNSAFYAPATPVGDMPRAITWLGFKQIYQLVTTVVGARLLDVEQRGYGIAKGELWRHSVAAAVAGRAIARRSGDDENLVFTAALLHDLGKIVLSEALEPIYERLVEETEHRQRTLLAAEKLLLGVHHAELGGQLLTRWRFPEPVINAVWYHHQPREAHPHERLAAEVYLGNLIAHLLGHSHAREVLAVAGCAQSLQLLELGAESLPALMMETLEAMATVKQLFGTL